jgi:hypothetical protein
MACGCGGGDANKNADGTPKTWVFKNDKGESQTYRSEIEARAAQIRSERAGKGAGVLLTK